METTEALADEARCCCAWPKDIALAVLSGLVLECGFPFDEVSSSLRGEREDDGEDAARGDRGGEWAEAAVGVAPPKNVRSPPAEAVWPTEDQPFDADEGTSPPPHAACCCCCCCLCCQLREVASGRGCGEGEVDWPALAGRDNSGVAPVGGAGDGAFNNFAGDCCVVWVIVGVLPAEMLLLLLLLLLPMAWWCEELCKDLALPPCSSIGLAFLVFVDRASAACCLLDVVEDDDDEAAAEANCGDCALLLSTGLLPGVLQAG